MIVFALGMSRRIRLWWSRQVVGLPVEEISHHLLKLMLMHLSVPDCEIRIRDEHLELLQVFSIVPMRLCR